MKQLQDHMSQLNYGSLATLTGRYYAMDRDKRYERIKIAYDGIVGGVGQLAGPDHVIEVCVAVVLHSQTALFLLIYWTGKSSEYHNRQNFGRTN